MKTEMKDGATMREDAGQGSLADTRALPTTRYGEMRVHPFADTFPMMSEAELQELAEDIAANGLIHPITLDNDGQLVDGRNRFAACNLAGVAPRFETLPEGTNPTAYILSANVERRHLNKGQRAMAIATAYYRHEKLPNDSAVSKGGRGKKSEARIAAKSAQVSNDYVEWATVVLRYAPELANAVMAGTLSLAEAHKAAQERKAQEESAARIAEVREHLRHFAEITVGMGQDLQAVRGALAPYGCFNEWCELAFDMPEWMARRYMRVAEQYAAADTTSEALPVGAIIALLMEPGEDENAREVAAWVAAHRNDDGEAGVWAYFFADAAGEVSS